MLINVIKKQQLKNVRRLELIQNNANMSPFIYLSIDRMNTDSNKRIMLYGHYDRDDLTDMSDIEVKQNKLYGPSSVDSSHIF